MEQVVIKEEDWQESKYRTIQWEQSVEIVRWEHDYEKKTYTITYTKDPNGNPMGMNI